MAKDIIVLGIHDGHNAGAALIKNGSVIAAMQEERLNNVKNYSGTPNQAILSVLEIANIHPSEINVIAIAGLVRSHSPIKERPFHVRMYERYAFLFKSHYINSLLINTLHKLRNMRELQLFFQSIKIGNMDILFCKTSCSTWRLCPLSMSLG